jgi:DNA polymerase III delta prime subunit
MIIPSPSDVRKMTRSDLLPDTDKVNIGKIYDASKDKSSQHDATSYEDDLAIIHELDPDDHRVVKPETSHAMAGEALIRSFASPLKAVRPSQDDWDADQDATDLTVALSVGLAPMAILKGPAHVGKTRTIQTLAYRCAHHDRIPHFLDGRIIMSVHPEAIDGTNQDMSNRLSTWFDQYSSDLDERYILHIPSARVIQLIPAGDDAICAVPIIVESCMSDQNECDAMESSDFMIDVLGMNTITAYPRHDLRIVTEIIWRSISCHDFFKDRFGYTPSKRLIHEAARIEAVLVSYTRKDFDPFMVEHDLQDLLANWHAHHSSKRITVKQLRSMAVDLYENQGIAYDYEEDRLYDNDASMQQHPSQQSEKPIICVGEGEPILRDEETDQPDRPAEDLSEDAIMNWSQLDLQPADRHDHRLSTISGDAEVDSYLITLSTMKKELADLLSKRDNNDPTSDSVIGTYQDALSLDQYASMIQACYDKAMQRDESQAWCLIRHFVPLLSKQANRTLDQYHHGIPDWRYVRTTNDDRHPERPSSQSGDQDVDDMLLDLGRIDHALRILSDMSMADQDDADKLAVIRRGYDEAVQAGEKAKARRFIKWTMVIIRRSFTAFLRKNYIHPDNLKIYDEQVDLSSILDEPEDAIFTFTDRADLTRKVRSHIIGQDHVFDRVLKPLIRRKAGFAVRNKPIAGVLLAGPSGVGKTETAMAIAAEAFGSTEHMLRIDCSSLKDDKMGVASLLGSGNGYVMSNKGGRLTNWIHDHPNGVVVFDEIEKADSSIADAVLLPMLDYGYITDASKGQVDCSGIYVIMTSNLGAQNMQSRGMKTIGFGHHDPSSDDWSVLDQDVVTAIKSKFLPELVNRFTDVIVYHPLSENDYMKIFNLKWAYIQHKTPTRQLTVTLSPEVQRWFAKQCQSDMYGARTLDRLIDEQIIDRLADVIIAAHDVEQTKVRIDVINDGLSIREEHDSTDADDRQLDDTDA